MGPGGAAAVVQHHLVASLLLCRPCFAATSWRPPWQADGSNPRQLQQLSHGAPAEVEEVTQPTGAGWGGGELNPRPPTSKQGLLQATRDLLSKRREQT